MDAARSQIATIKKRYLPMDPISDTDRRIIRRLEAFIRDMEVFDAWRTAIHDEQAARVKRIMEITNAICAILRIG